MLDARLFAAFQTLAYEKAGIAIRCGKERLVEARVGKRVRALRLPSEEAYLEFLRSDSSGAELVQFLDAISTNFTSFFRERDHFEHMTRAVQAWARRGQTRFRLWSAASSSGEEPYTMAITMLEALEQEPIDFRILATDISTRMLRAGREAVYEKERLAPMDRALQLKYFEPAGRGLLQARPSLTDAVTFARLNLSAPPFPMSGPMDIIFCRNVMIYFDRAVRQGLVSEIERLLRPGGYLLIGHSETLTGLETDLRTVRASVYQKPSRRGAP